MGRVRESSLIGTTAEATGGPDRHRLEMLAIARTASNLRTAQYTVDEKKRDEIPKATEVQATGITLRPKRLSDGPPVGRIHRQEMYDAAFAGSAGATSSNSAAARFGGVCRGWPGRDDRWLRPRDDIAVRVAGHQAHKSCSQAVQLKACEFKQTTRRSCAWQNHPIGSLLKSRWRCLAFTHVLRADE